MEGKLELDEVPAKLAVDAESLRRYLAARLPGFSCEVRALRVRQFSHGESNPTYHLLASGGQEYVMRRRPQGKLLPGAHRVSGEGVVIFKQFLRMRTRSLKFIICIYSLAFSDLTRYKYTLKNWDWVTGQAHHAFCVSGFFIHP